MATDRPPLTIHQSPKDITPTPDFPTDRILNNLAKALDQASHRLVEVTGKTRFHDDTERKTILALLKLLPSLLAHLRNHPNLVPLDSHAFHHAVQEHAQYLFDSYNPNAAPGRIPRCPICLQGPGAHWAEDCPERQYHHDIIKIKELQAKARI